MEKLTEKLWKKNIFLEVLNLFDYFCMNKKIQLFMLPYAGGNSFSFYKVNRFLDNRIESIPVEYSGRGFRSQERLINNYTDYLDDVSKFITNHRNEELPYALLGYSFGSAMSYDIVRKNLINNEKPVHIFFCAEGGLKHLGEINKNSNIDDKVLFEEMKKLGGFSEKLLNNPESLKSIFSLIKNDFTAYQKFSYEYEPITIDCSIINSESDFTATYLEEWENISMGNIEYYQLGENHFFINDKFRELAEIINDKLICFLH